MSFLKAEWRKLVLANYEVRPELLQAYLPKGTELDYWNGTLYVSLVGFRFVNVKLLGIKIPFHTHFEEVNLRFYVRRKEAGEWRRGVVFIKEIVPRHAITFVANTLYAENYVTHRMNHEWLIKDNTQKISYTWEQGKHRHSMTVNTELSSFELQRGSEEEFITEHYWGYTKVNERKTYEYEVTHPKWEAYPIQSFDINVDFGLAYGDAFKYLNQQAPLSVMLAEGSEITVENKRSLNI